MPVSPAMPTSLGGESTLDDPKYFLRNDTLDDPGCR
jgi:hypothetical protein